MVMREDIVRRIETDKLIAIIRGVEQKYVLGLVQALLDGGISLVEITLNQSGTQEENQSFADTVRMVKDEFGSDVRIGVGTVMDSAQLAMASEAGAEFIVSPNVNPSVIRKTREAGLVSIPGAMTPSECAVAHDAGADFVKLFPAGSLGPGYLKALRAPLNHIKFLAVGGIDEKNLCDYMNAGAAGFGVGGNLVNRDWIHAGAYEKITDLAKDYVRAVHNVH